MNRDDVIDVLTAITAADRRTIGDADVAIWQEIIGGDDKQLALRAVRDHLAECPGVWMEPGHVHQRVRAIVRDRLEREPDKLREARQGQISARVAEHMAEITAALDTKFQRPSRRHGVNPLAVRCPWCHASPGQHCTVPQTRRRPHGGAHPSRIEAAQEAIGHAVSGTT